MEDLLNLSAEIMRLDAIESSLGKGREWKDAKARYEAAVELFKTRRKEYVDSLLVKGEDWASISNEVASELARIESEADPSWQSAITYARDNLLPYLTKEARRSPLMRDLIKWTPVAAGAVAVIAYFTIRLSSGLDVSAPFESQLGLKQRAAATEKVIRYDDWMETRVRRGRWLKGILLWPIEPTTSEIEGAAEFASISLQGHDALAQRGEICSNLVEGYDAKLSDGQIEFIDQMADGIQSDKLQWDSKPMVTVLDQIRAKYPCQ